MADSVEWRLVVQEACQEALVQQWKMGGGLREKKGGRCCLLEMGSKIHLGFTFLFLDVYCNTEVHTVALFEVLLAIFKL